MKLKSMMMGAGILVASVALAAPVLAQTGGMQDGSGPGARTGRMYNPQTVGTITGEVVSVDAVAPMMGLPRSGMGMSRARMRQTNGIHLLVKTATESISVQLGPAWFVGRQPVQIKQGDTVKVTGSRITFAGKPAIVASEVSKDGQVLKLRDANGVPAWAGRGRR